MTDHLVVSGLGLTTPFGVGAQRFWDGLWAGESRLRLAPVAGGTETVCGQVPLPEDTRPRRSRLLRGALREALGGADHPAEPDRTLLVVVGQSPWTVAPNGDEDALEVAAGWPREDLRRGFADVVYLSQACASVFFGLGYARDWIRSGLGDAAIIAGAFTINRYEYLGMSVVRALSGTGARPFDDGRDGTSLGEGSTALLVETESRARARGVRPLAAITGLECRIGGHSRTDSDPDTLLACIEGALGQAGIDRADYVHAHATGTPQGDAVELEVLDRLGTRLGWHGIPAGSHKGAIGHLMHVSGGAAVAAGLGALRTAIAPGTPGLHTPIETSAAIDLLATPRQIPRLRTVLINSFGFAGNSAAMVLSAMP
ncbi:beta-ketoacyl synthase N-terminal-like domain-containing protein [Streptomyces sp. YGL11-2]|uniref:beta-ketoacyl synthase N-terminal-like domain-containing protein n=1 Tax=Streptomyces sp. YGL11-2 TaxID=3414028 RepID=UPI003CEA4CDD